MAALCQSNRQACHALSGQNVFMETHCCTHGVTGNFASRVAGCFLLSQEHLEVNMWKIQEENSYRISPGKLQISGELHLWKDVTLLTRLANLKRIPGTGSLT